jgi:hypothetical protein
MKVEKKPVGGMRSPAFSTLGRKSFAAMKEFAFALRVSRWRRSAAAAATASPASKRHD